MIIGVILGSCVVRFVHWSEDKLLSHPRDGFPAFVRRILDENELHHSTPDAMISDYPGRLTLTWIWSKSATSVKGSLLLCPVLCLMFWHWWLIFDVSTFLITVCGANLYHALMHLFPSGRAWRILRKFRFVDPSYHAKHHERGESHFSIVLH